MKTLIKLCLVAIVMLSATNAEAQFWKKMKEKVGKKIEEAIVRKTEENAVLTTEDAVDSIFGNSEKKRKERRRLKKQNDDSTVMETSNEIEGMPDLGGILDGMMDGDTTVEDEYIFPITATMEVTNYEGNGETNYMTQSYGETAIMSDVQQAGLVINDFKNETAIIINQEANTAQVMSLGWMKKMMEGQLPESEDDEQATVTQTGESKELNGYTCYQYLIEFDEGSIDAWFAPDVPFNYEDYLSGFTKMFGAQMAQIPTANGYVMEMSNYKANGDLMMTMLITNISEETQVITMSGYEVQTLMGK